MFKTNITWGNFYSIFLWIERFIAYGLIVYNKPENKLV